MNTSDLFEQMPSKRRTLKDLASYIKTKSGNSPNYSIFLGAGASVTSGINSGTQLVEEWRKEIYELSSSSPYTDVKTARQYLNDKESSWYDPTNEYSSLFQKKIRFTCSAKEVCRETGRFQTPFYWLFIFSESFSKCIFRHCFYNELR